MNKLEKSQQFTAWLVICMWLTLFIIFLIFFKYFSFVFIESPDVFDYLTIGLITIIGGVGTMGFTLKLLGVDVTKDFKKVKIRRQ